MTGQKRGERVNRIYATFFARAKAQAKMRRLTISDLAESTTMSEERIAAILEGFARDVTLYELAALSVVLDISVTDLLSPNG